MKSSEPARRAEGLLAERGDVGVAVEERRQALGLAQGRGQGDVAELRAEVRRLHHDAADRIDRAGRRDADPGELAAGRPGGGRRELRGRRRVQASTTAAGPSSRGCGRSRGRPGCRRASTTAARIARAAEVDCDDGPGGQGETSISIVLEGPEF